MSPLRIIRGLLLTLILAALPAAVLHAQATATLNLKDVDIRVLIDTVSEVTGKNFVIDPRVKAKVTVVSSRPMQKEELYQVFLSILEVHGFAAVEVGNIIKIVPDVNAKQGPVPTRSETAPGTGDELVTRVIEVRNVPAAQLVPILRPLVPQQGHLAAYPTTNVLVISDRASNIERLAAIIRRIDLADTDEIEVIPLQYASAAEVVRVVSSLLQQTDPKGGQVPGQPVLAADDRTNSVLLAGDKPARLRLRAIIAHLDTPLESVGDTQVIFLKYADAKDLVTILQGATTGQAPAQQQKGAAPAGKQEVDIQADESTNALIITGPPAIQRSLASVIRQLDIPRAQVLIEAIIAEVGTDLTNELGVQFGALPRDDSGLVGGTNFGGPGRSIVSIVANPQLVGPGLTLGVGDLSGNQQWAVLVNALARDAATNILSTPTLVTMDNAEAEIVVGQEVPFVTGSFTTSVDTGGLSTNPFQTVERQDVGVILRVKPQINEGDALKLELEQEVSSVAPSSLVVNDLVTNRRSIKTTVMAEDRQVVILGGLIEDSFRDNEEKVPLLGDIPVVGALFRYDTTTKTKQNLMVLIHPVILRDQLTANHYTEQKYSVLRARQIEAEITERGLIRGEDELLPDIGDLITSPPPPRTAPAPEPPAPAAPASTAPAPATAAPPSDPVSTAPPSQPSDDTLPRIVVPPTVKRDDPAVVSPASDSAATGPGVTNSGWLSQQDPRAYTVQLAASDNAEDLGELYRSSGAEAPAALARVTGDGSSWYVLLSGVYPDRAAARNAISRLPLSLQGYQPWIRRIGDVQSAAGSNSAQQPVERP